MKRKKKEYLLPLEPKPLSAIQKKNQTNQFVEKKSLKFAHKNRFHTKSCYVVQRETQCLKQTYSGHFAYGVNGTATNSILITLLAFHLRQSVV